MAHVGRLAQAGRADRLGARGDDRRRGGPPRAAWPTWNTSTSAGTKVTGACLANFRGMTKLKEPPPRRHPRLRRRPRPPGGPDQPRILDLTSTPVTDAGLAHLEGLVNLKHSGSAPPAVTGRGARALEGHDANEPAQARKGARCETSSISRHCPALKVLYLDETPIDDCAARLPLEDARPGDSLPLGHRASPMPGWPSWVEELEELLL